MVSPAVLNLGAGPVFPTSLNSSVFCWLASHQRLTRLKSTRKIEGFQFSNKDSRIGHGSTSVPQQKIDQERC
jgi:hypothetical protein